MKPQPSQPANALNTLALYGPKYTTGPGGLKARKVLIIAAALLCFALIGQTAQAATFTVNQSGDAGDGVCDATCTLRDAVTAANGAASDDIITFNSSITNIALTSEIVIANNGTLTISGPGADQLTISGGGTGTNRLFSVNAGANVTITGVKLTGGGGTGASDSGRGGAIYVNSAALTLDGVYITNNTADFYGGGVYFLAGGPLRIRNSTFSSNTATQFSGGGFYAIFIGAYVSNSTFSGNAAGQLGGGFIVEQASATLRNVTMSANTASQGGGVAGVSGNASIDLGNTIVAGNTGTGGRNELSSTSGAVLTSSGNNLIGDSTGDAADTNSTITYQSTDILDTNPMLGTFKNNLGTTPTYSLQPNSPAIDKGDNAKAVDPFNNSALTTDQRGLPRIVDAPPPPNTATVDIGAYEVQIPAAAGANISGIVSSPDGTPLAGVVLRLSGTASAFTITDSSGRYHFDSIESAGFYTVTPQLANYNFSPRSRSFPLVGNKTDAGFTAVPDSAPSTNPLDTPEYFIRQQYLDFLGREPDQGGLDFWSNQIRQCGSDASCIHQRRLDVSAAFFMSDEFQQTGSFIYRLYRASYGRMPNFSEFSQDRSHVVDSGNLEAVRAAFATEFVNRPAFRASYPDSLSHAEFVNRLFDAAGVAGSREPFVTLMDNGATRSEVLMRIIEDASFRQAEYNRSFVLMQYFGYLRRDADEGGFNFWLDVLNNRVPGNYRSMVCAFLTSTEYQRRFSSVVTHSNQDCSQ